MSAEGDGADRARSLIVLAKQPLPHRAKTRLQPAFTPDQAAELAAAALADTVAVTRRAGARRRFLAFDGDPAGWDDGFTVLPQPGGGLDRRLAAAFADAAHSVPDGRGEPTLLIGMDTPQVSAAVLDSPWHGADAVLGLSEDGGFWAIGLRSADPYAVFDGIPMSTDRTGAAQLARLSALGLSVELLPPLRDIDEPADAEHVADRHPELRFSRRYRELESLHAEQPIDKLFDRLYLGSGVTGRRASGSTRAATFTESSRRWTSSADRVDEMVVSRCEPPVIDIGCGPGRMVSALQQSGRAALGIDLSAVAVQLGHGQGGQLLRRGLHDELPAEGRWATALLLDGNLGIGGDVAALLTRCRHLVGPGGLILCEVDPDPECHERFELVLVDGRHACVPTPWVCVGLHTILRLAPRLDLLVVEEWCAAGRAFVSMRTAA